MNRAELVKTLELVRPALATNNMIPVFECFVFSDKMVSAYNDTIGIVGPTEFGLECGLHGNTLLGLLSATKAETVEAAIANQEVTIKMGKTVSKLPFFANDAFIFEPPSDVTENPLAITQSVIDAMTVCLETVSSDATQAALLGVTLEGKQFYSCDSDSLTRVNLKAGVKGRVLLPTQFCQAVLKLWDALGIEKGNLTFNDQWIMASFGEWAVYGRVLQIKQPINFGELITRNTKGKTELAFVEAPADLNGALSRARVFSDAESKKTELNIKAGKLTLRTETHMGNVDDALSFKGHHDVAAMINASHFQRALGHCNTLRIHENCVEFAEGNVYMLISNM